MPHLLHSILPTPRRKLEIVSPDTTVAECIEIMKTKDIGALVVMDNQDLLGIVGERDIIRNACHQDGNFNAIRAMDIVFKRVSVLSEHDSVEKAMQVITATKRRHILIKENHVYVAIISIGDLMFHLLDEDLRVIQHLEKYIVG
jgi:CBS domain-containing protein